MQNKGKIIAALESIARSLTAKQRADNSEHFKLLGESLKLKHEEYRHLCWPLPAWPGRPNRADKFRSEYRFIIDFSYGENPDSRPVIATFEEVCKFLNYTPGSCKVSFVTGRNTVDRRKRPTILGPCVITKIPMEIPEDERHSFITYAQKYEEMRGARSRGRGKY